jgi:hypothetical protein
MPVISVTYAQADDPIYNSGVTMSFINHSEPRAEKVFALVDVYRRNKFLIKDNTEDIWFGIEQQIDKKYFEIPFAIVTAWNPMNESYSKEANIWLNNKLEVQIKTQKYAYDYTVGECDGHSEDSFIVYRISKREALKLVQEFRQYSIFYNDTRSLEYIECKTENILLKSNISGTIFEEAYVPKYFSFDEMASAEEITETLKENNCICPLSTHWNRLWERLRDSNVPKPLILGAWHTTSDAEKQARLFEHVRYAQEHNRLSLIISFMNKLETNQWYLGV